jgi:hypothetical protein
VFDGYMSDSLLVGSRFSTKRYSPQNVWPVYLFIYLQWQAIRSLEGSGIVRKGARGRL